MAPRKSTVTCCAAGELELTVPATPAHIPAVTAGVMQFLDDQNWAEDDLAAVELSLQEALANGVRHGCQGDPSKHVYCLVTCDAAGDVFIIVRDEGAGFDVAAVPNPLDDANVMKPGGRGVFLINRLMDEVAFTDGGREVRMRKHLNARRD